MYLTMNVTIFLCLFLSFNYIVTGARQLAAAIDFWAPEARTRRQELPRL